MTRITPEQRSAIHQAVNLAITLWPNAHLGDYSPRQDMRSAFKMIRSHAEYHNDLWQGIYALEREVLPYMHM